MAEPSAYLARLEHLKTSLKWVDSSLSEMSERLRLLGILYEVADTVDFFEQATDDARETIIIRKISDVDFDYWININNWDIPEWLSHEEFQKSYLSMHWNLKSNREYISDKVGNDISCYIPSAPEHFPHNDEQARADMRGFLKQFQGVFFNSYQLRGAIYNAIQALIQTLCNLSNVLSDERTDEEYIAWYNDLRLEFSTKLITNISKNYASVYNQRLGGPSRDWLLERFGDAAYTFWNTPFMQARKDACTYQECKNQTIYFDIPNLSKDQQRKFFHALLEFGTFSENGYVIDKPAQVARCLYRLFLVNAHEQAILDFFTFQLKAQIISADLPLYPAEKQSKKKKADTFKPDYITFTKHKAQRHHIIALYQALIALKWIADGNPDDFLALFSGEISECRIVWIGKGKDNLYQLFRMLVDDGFISVPKGHGVQRIVESHFVDINGNYVTGIDSGKPSENALSSIKSLRKLLITQVTKQQMDDYDFGKDFG